jgi:hypothetical protein
LSRGDVTTSSSATAFELIALKTAGAPRADLLKRAFPQLGPLETRLPDLAPGDRNIFAIISTPTLQRYGSFSG